MNRQWILLHQVAGPDANLPWAVGYLDARTGHVTSISWYYTEDEARLAHHRLTN